MLKHIKDEKELNKTDNYGYTPFYYACAFSHLEIVKEMLLLEKYKDYKIDYNKPGNNTGYTPFIIACSDGRLEIIRELLKHKDKIDFNKTNNHGKTAFYLACENSKIDIVKEILKENNNNIIIVIE